MGKSKVHEIVIKVRFDKACSNKLARYIVNDHLKFSDYYCSTLDESEPQKFAITKISRCKQ